MRTLKQIPIALFLMMGIPLTAQGAMHLVDVSGMNSLSGDLYFDHTVEPTISEDSPTSNLIEIPLKDFTVSGSAGGVQQAHDNIWMTITAPAGFYITGISYFESGTSSITDGGTILAVGSLIVGNAVTPLNNRLLDLTNGTVNNGNPVSFDFFTGLVPVNNLTEISLSATNTLLAGSLTGTATVTKTAASIGVELAPIPVPPAVWLFGSALAGLIAVRRRAA